MKMVISLFFRRSGGGSIVPEEREKICNKTIHRCGFSMLHQMEFIHFLLNFFLEQFSLVIRHFPFRVTPVFCELIQHMLTSFQFNHNYVRHDGFLSRCLLRNTPRSFFLVFIFFAPLEEANNQIATKK